MAFADMHNLTVVNGWGAVCSGGTVFLWDTKQQNKRGTLKDELIDLSLGGKKKKKNTSEHARLSQAASERSHGQLARSRRVCAPLFVQHFIEGASRSTFIKSDEISGAFIAWLRWQRAKQPPDKRRQDLGSTTRPLRQQTCARPPADDDLGSWGEIYIKKKNPTRRGAPTFTERNFP